jgi:hypothetical protein
MTNLLKLSKPWGYPVSLSYQLYQDRKKPEGMRIDVGPNGLTIEKK